VVIVILFAVMGLTAWLYIAVPKGFFPQTDNGQLMAGIRADQSVSFQAMEGKLRAVVEIIRKDPAVDTVVGFTGGAGRAAASCSSISSPSASARKRAPPSSPACDPNCRGDRRHRSS
jgi:multidrug efflux pump